MKIAIYGAGSLGTVLGAYLAKAGIAVDLVTRNKEHVSALNANGATIIGTVQMNVPVHALTPDQIDVYKRQPQSAEYCACQNG